MHAYPVMRPRFSVRAQRASYTGDTQHVLHPSIYPSCVVVGVFLCSLRCGHALEFAIRRLVLRLMFLCSCYFTASGSSSGSSAALTGGGEGVMKN